MKGEETLENKPIVMGRPSHVPSVYLAALDALLYDLDQRSLAGLADRRSQPDELLPLVRRSQESHWKESRPAKEKVLTGPKRLRDKCRARGHKIAAMKAKERGW